MGSKLIGFRMADDLAEQLETKAAEEGQSTSEFLRRLVDEALYPGPGQERLEARREAPETMAEFEKLYGVSATEHIAKMVNAQIKEELHEQLGAMVDAHLELVQIDRGLTEAEKEHYNGSLASLERELATLKVGVNKLVRVVNDNTEAYEGVSRTVNKNVELCNGSFDQLSRLFQLLEAHSHDDAGKVEVPRDAESLLCAEVQRAEKWVGEFPVGVRKGKVEKPGWKYLEQTKVSIKKE